MHIKSTHIFLSFLLTAVLAFSSSCFKAGGGKTPGSGSGQSDSDEEQEEEENLSANLLSQQRLLRRLSIDLLNELPSPEDVDAFANGELDFLTVIDQYLANSASHRAISEKARSFWDLNLDTLPELERIAESDDNFSSSDLENMRKDILSEPIWVLRYHLSQGHSFDELFKGKITISKTAVLSLWNVPTGESLFDEDNLFLSSYSDSRPSLGILASNGFAATTDSEGDSDAYNRGLSFLKRFSCQTFDAKSAHDFSIVDSTNLTNIGTARSFALNDKNCAGCHRQFVNIGKALSGLGYGSTLNSYRDYDGTGFNFPIYYSGLSISSFDDLAETIGNDPKVQLCMLKGLWSHISQRPFNNAADRSVLRIVEQQFSNEGTYSLTSAVMRMVRAESYQYDIFDADSDTALGTTESGARFLTAAQLEGILRQLSNNAASIEISIKLNPGSEDDAQRDHYSPSGSYFRELQKVAQQAASAIATDELNGSSQAASRTLLTGLPDGQGIVESEDMIDQQIIAAWKKLTSLDISNEDEQFEKLKSIWNQGYSTSGSEAEKTKSAWSLTIMAIMLSPDFFLY